MMSKPKMSEEEEEGIEDKDNRERGKKQKIEEI
jgi:hypothetical protein